MISLDAKNQGGPGKDEFKTQFYYKVVCVKKAYDSSKVVKDGHNTQHGNCGKNLNWMYIDWIP